MKKMLVDALGASGAVILICLFVLFLLILGPWLLFWSVGVLSAAAGTPIVIPLTFWNWVAAVVFIGLLRGGK